MQPQIFPLRKREPLIQYEFWDWSRVSSLNGFCQIVDLRVQGEGGSISGAQPQILLWQQYRAFNSIWILQIRLKFKDLDRFSQN